MLSYYTNENQGKAHELVNNPVLKASLQQHVVNIARGTRTTMTKQNSDELIIRQRVLPACWRNKNLRENTACGQCDHKGEH